MNKLLTILLSLFIVHCSLFIDHCYAVNLKIKIYSDYKFIDISLIPVSGTYKIINLTNKNKVIFNNKASLNIKLDSNKIYVYEKNKLIGKYDSLQIKGTGLLNAFKITPENNKKLERYYNDNLILKIRKNLLFLLNDIDLEHYLTGVVESESGNKISNLEFYKVQATICRTYALKNKGKHQNEGYNLCDNEHCQVYRGRSRNPEIILAVSKTNGEIVIDKRDNLINAAFHANCGGQTVNSEDVWSRPTPYLVSINDTFCIKMSKATWEKTITKKDMLTYLAKNNIKDTIVIDSLLNFHQNTRKSIFFDTIKLKNLRTYFDLKSSYFTIIPNGDSLLFKGRGNGHGIGLCQEGAMNMALHGYIYTDIIKHYYKEVRISNIYKNYSQK